MKILFCCDQKIGGEREFRVLRPAKTRPELNRVQADCVEKMSTAQFPKSNSQRITELFCLNF